MIILAAKLQNNSLIWTFSGRAILFSPFQQDWGGSISYAVILSGNKVGLYIDKVGSRQYKVRPCGKQLNHEILGKSFYFVSKADCICC